MWLILYIHFTLWYVNAALLSFAIFYFVWTSRIQAHANPHCKENIQDLQCKKSFIHAIVLESKQTMTLGLRSYSWYRWNSSICSVRGFLHRLSCSPTKDKYLSIDFIPWLFYPPICPGKQSLRCIIRAHIKKNKTRIPLECPNT